MLQSPLDHRKSDAPSGCIVVATLGSKDDSFASLTDMRAKSDPSLRSILSLAPHGWES